MMFHKCRFYIFVNLLCIVEKNIKILVRIYFFYIKNNVTKYKYLKTSNLYNILKYIINKIIQLFFGKHFSNLLDLLYVCVKLAYHFVENHK